MLATVIYSYDGGGAGYDGGDGTANQEVLHPEVPQDINVSSDGARQAVRFCRRLRYDIRENEPVCPDRNRTIPVMQVTPVWFERPRRFYDRLAAAQKEFSIPRAKLLMRGLDLAIKEQQAKRSPAKSSNSDDAGLSDAPRRVAERCWQAASAERKAVGQKLAAARWAKKQTKKSGKAEAS
jgi:hypothetical protein